MMVVLYPQAAFNSGIITVYVCIYIYYMYIYIHFYLKGLCNVYAYDSETVRVKHRFLLASMVRN